MTMKSTVMKLANALHYQKGLSRSKALKTAWRMAKQAEFYSKVVGVSFGLRQTALLRLQRYSPEEIRISLVRENHPQDPNAIATVVTVKGKGFRIGYLPREIAKLWAPLVAAGRVAGELEQITGGKDRTLGAVLKLKLVA
jgi:hypothetical protein